MSTNISETINKLKPIDDTFFAKLAENAEFCQEILRVILQKPELVVVDAQPQKVLHNIEGRSVIVDVLCQDSEENYYNVEMQKQNDDDHQKRVRYNSSNIDTYIAEKGIKFRELPDVYIVYITAFDYFKEGKTIYHVERVLRETGTIVYNGLHEVYVNTEVDDGTDIAGLMKIFQSSQLESDKRFPVTCKTIKNLKQGEGSDNMCSVVEEYAKEYAKEHAKEYAKEYAREVARKLIIRGNDNETVAELTDLTLEEVQEVRKSC